MIYSMLMSHNGNELPSDFWNRPQVAKALSQSDFSVILDAIRSEREWSQSELAHAVGYSQSWISRVVNGRQSLTLDQAREIAHRLGIPLHRLRFAIEGTRRVAPAQRRDPGAGAAAGVVSTGAPGVLREGDPTAETLRVITGHQRRLDATSPACDLAHAAIAHSELAGQTLVRALRTGSPCAPELAAVAGEAAGFAAWLHMDLTDTGSARGYYRLAVERARQADHPLLTGYMLGSLAAFEIDADDPEAGLALAAEAEHCLGRSAHPTAAAWLSCIRALGHAGCGDAAAATGEIARAERATNRAENRTPPWPWVFPFSPEKVAGYRGQAALRLNRPLDALNAFAEAAGRTVVAAKQRALLLVEWARASAAAGELDPAFSTAQEALRTARELRSERVLAKARRFRRSYTGPPARSVREFDERLAELTSVPGSGVSV